MSLQVDSKAFIRTEIPLKSYSTFKIGGNAKFFAEPQSQEELAHVLDFRRQEGASLLVIGRGSNLLISDDGFNGLAVSLRKFESDRYSIDKDGCIRVSAGMSLFRLSALAQEHSLGGAEFVCHIPGTVGGAIIMNAGFGRRGLGYFEIKDILDSFTAMDHHGEIKTFKRNEIVFEYRKTNIPEHLIILEATFRLQPKDRTLVEQEIKANFVYRNAVQDLRFPSAGSTFKNPEHSEFTSGQLLDKAKMKKVRIGGAMVSERHANFFLNVDHATAQDVLDLMDLAQKRVYEAFGIKLEPEVRYVG